MPKAKGKGGKNRRRGKGQGGQKRELVFKEEGQEYAQVVKILGNGRLDVQCFDGEKRLALIRGKLRRRVFIVLQDILLVSLRDFQDSKCDVLQKYTPDEARELKKYGQLPETAKINENEGEEVGGGSDIEFGEVSEEDEEEDDDEDLDDL